MSKEWKRIGDIVDGTFIKVDSISDSFIAAYPEITHKVTIGVGNQEVSFEGSALTVVNPKDLVEAAQQQAWEIARKVYISEEQGGFSTKELQEIFWCNYTFTDIYKLPFKDVVARIEAWENQIKVGDEVVRKFTRSPKYVVTKVTKGCVTGTVTFCAIDNVTGTTLENVKADGYAKTGKKFKVKKGFFEEVKE